MKYAVIGSALYGNKGASAMLETLVQGLEALDDDAQFVLFSLYPSQDVERNDFENLSIVPASPLALVLAIIPLCLVHRYIKPLRPWLAGRSLAVRELSQSHVYVDQCGISFNDGRLTFLVYNIAVLLPGLLMRLPIVKVAQALGPFKSRINRLAAKLILPRLHHIFARGEITFSHLQSLGLTNISEGTDLALAFSPTRNAESPWTAALPQLDNADRELVGIAPSAVAARKAAAANIDYVDAMARLIDSISERGYWPILFPHSARPDSEREHNNDLPLCRAIHAALARPDTCQLIDQELTTSELRDLIGTCTCVVTSRFHAMVGALAVEVPCLVVGWSHKYEEVLSPFGLEDQALDYRNCEQHQLTARFDHTVSHSAEIRGKLSRALPRMRSLAFQQISLVHETATIMAPKQHR
ncbi:polysaccharide pyruvyl transferase family protein [Wenzhouxiangella sp. EGI_FJ10409]|uniref:polysaccharide pyruvyl transferase family protein n=1 Tax=Wenzhouxiangella sp. EGI_FJ10409 TaxID=3243767 RepID=UPI0035D53D49